MLLLLWLWLLLLLLKIIVIILLLLFRYYYFIIFLHRSKLMSYGSGGVAYSWILDNRKKMTLKYTTSRRMPEYLRSVKLPIQMNARWRVPLVKINTRFLPSEIWLRSSTWRRRSTETMNFFVVLFLLLCSLVAPLKSEFTAAKKNLFLIRIKKLKRVNVCF